MKLRRQPSWSPLPISLLTARRHTLLSIPSHPHPAPEGLAESSRERARGFSPIITLSSQMGTDRPSRVPLHRFHRGRQRVIRIDCSATTQKAPASPENTRSLLRLAKHARTDASSRLPLRNRQTLTTRRSFSSQHTRSYAVDSRAGGHEEDERAGCGSLTRRVVLVP